MRRRFLSFIARTAFRFAGVLSLILALLTAMSVSGLRHLRLDAGLSDFLSPDSPQARRIGPIMRDYRNLEPIVVDIRGLDGATESDLIDVANALAAELRDTPYFTEPVYKVDALAQEYYESLSDVRLIALLTTQDWDYFTNLMQERILSEQLGVVRHRRLSAFLPRRPDFASSDPLGVLAEIRQRLTNTRAPIPITPRRGYFFTPDGRTLQMLLFAVRPSDDALNALRTTTFLNSTREYLLEHNEAWRSLADIQFSGSHIETAAKLRSMIRDLALIGGSSLFFVLMFLVLTFRKVEALAFILLPPVLGSVWALGLAHAFCRAFGINTVVELDQVYTRFTGVTVAFLLITFGIGLSYSVHLFHRFTMELYRHRSYYRALHTAYVETGRGVLASGLTSALIFFSLYLTSFRGFKELGVMAGVATLCNLAAVLLTMPTLAALKSWLAKGRVRPIALYRMRMAGLSEPAIRAPRVTLAALLLISVFLGVGYRSGRLSVLSLDFHPHFMSIAAYLFHPETAQEGPAQGSPRPGRPLVGIVQGETIQEALEKNDQLYDDLVRLRQQWGEQLGILTVDSLRVVLPSLDTQRRSLDTMKNIDLKPLNESIENSSRAAGFQPVIFQSILDQIADLQERSADAELTEYSSPAGEAFNEAVRRKVTHRDGTYRVATPIFPSAQGFSQEQLQRLIRLINPTEEHVKFIGDPIVESQFSERIKYDLALLAFLSSLSVFFALFLHFRRNIRYALLASVPIAVELLWVCGAMSHAGIPLHFLTLMALPLVVTLSLDNSIHLLQHFLDRNPDDVRLTVISLGRSVVLSCVVVGLLYGTLGFVDGLRDLGFVCVFGALASLVGTLVLLPALIQIWGRDQTLLSVLRPQDSSE